ncbi:uncharacterized protein I303_101547 [Kwoniella dejecticola CBS 10117]|uniref:Uncharacterized protein n=1 Tax=Kwoniella dejecticola CBS 10117 TaxID=1296121 RepID=A0A1A6ADF9_9TREE|nr:uncharacterized protein I303_02321 [Kwoniella dejecticola CBS 10117]OBR88102.1 hypothetical protein I303_02321 [Kwoniella dejecticola CBS 10117]
MTSHSNKNFYACSAHYGAHARTNSSTSVNTLASDISISSSASTSSISSTSSSASSSFSRSTPIDRECLRWMQRESDCDHIFGSVTSRGNSLSVEERDVRRRAMEVEEMQSASVESEEESRNKAIKAERRKGKVGKWF